MHYINSQSGPIGVHLNLSRFMSAWWGVDRLATVAASNHSLNYLSRHISVDLSNYVQHSVHSHMKQIVQLFHLLFLYTTHCCVVFLHFQPALSYPNQKIGLIPVKGHEHYAQL